VTTDIESLMHNSRHVTRGAREDMMTDAEYLAYRRILAEATLIKSKILYKVDQDVSLSDAEREYLQKWME